MKSILLRIAGLGMVLLMAPQQGLSQDNGWTGPGTNWATGSNWEFGVPLPSLDGRAVINTGPTATVSTNVTSSPTVVLGEGAGLSGALTVGTGGTLNVQTGVGDPQLEPGAGEGKVLIGRNGGTGTVVVSGNGKLLVAGEISTPTDGAAASSLSLSGTAMVTAGSAFFDKKLSISGSTVSMSIAGDAIFGLGGTHTWTMPAAGAASTIQVAGDADLGGTLEVKFTGGTPTVGTTWNLISSLTVDDAEGANPSGFNAIDQAGVTGLLPGQSFSVSKVAGGLGYFTRLTLEQHPVLLVDRGTGLMKIKNYGASPTVGFDHYSVRSPLGFLNVGDWNSLDDQNLGTWVEANPESTALSEIEMLNTASLAGGAEYTLGNAFDLGMPMQLGDITEDLTFEFTKPGQNTPIQGQIVFTGNPVGNVVLTVDPATGKARMRNNSPFTIAIDTYAILSESGSLLSGNANWSSLDDQNAAGGDWIEANVGPTQLSELQTFNTTTLAPGTFYSLGTPFSTSGKRDLEFKYALAGEDVFRDGIVNYATLPSLYTADFDGDGDVDSADLTRWNSGYGVNAAGDANFDAKSSGIDFLTWQLQYGSTTPPLSGVVAIPEPATFLLSWSWILGLLGLRRVRALATARR